MRKLSMRTKEIFQDRPTNGLFFFIFHCFFTVTTY